VKTGVILPSFRDDPTEALEVAHQAEEAGVDGVFCFDHLWPMGRPDRPAIAPFPLLAAVASTTERVCVGTTVARVGLVPAAVLVSEFTALELLAPGRVIAGLGTGDHLSAKENLAYGVPFETAEARQGHLRVVAADLRERDIPVWVGGGAHSTNRVAKDVGVAINLWDAAPEAVERAGAGCEVTWSGPSHERGELARLLPALERAGATWAVFTWPVPLVDLSVFARQ
jgi:alkanesulfonate monooxygenase SsuD/methylene tetrahydromethanopterin reductase-like flavin-dependent oxidoreductase (luciferase family)